jgi:hypothetical protein
MHPIRPSQKFDGYSGYVKLDSVKLLTTKQNGGRDKPDKLERERELAW